MRMKRLTLRPFGHPSVTIVATVCVTADKVTITVTDGTHTANFEGVDEAEALANWAPVLEWKGNIRKTLAAHFQILEFLITLK